MKELARHIEILLLDNDCVIVPGLGGFVAHPIPARRIEEERKFMPPYRTLGFSPKMQLNDGLLVQSFMQAYDATYPEALKIVESKVQDMKEILSTEGVLELHGIGTLRQNIDGECTFIPLEAGLLSPSLYGFCPFEMLTLAQLDAQETKRQVLIPPTTPAPTIKKPIVIQMNRAWATGIAAACAALIVVVLLAFPGNSGETKMASFKPLTEWFHKANKAETITRIPVKAVKPATDVVNKPQPKIQSTASTTATKAEGQPKPEAKPSTTDNFYTIVLASCVTEKNAQQFVKQLSQKGFAEGEVMTRHNITRVIYAHFASESEAANRLHELRKTGDTFTESWVMQVK